MPDPGQRPARFHWPPRPASNDPPPIPTDRESGSVDTPHEPWWSQLERVWLGRTASSWPERARDAGWTPDAPSDYCPRCGRSVGVHELRDLDDDPTRPPACSACERRRVPWTRLVRLGPYDGVLRHAILEGKFSAWRRLVRDLGRDLAHALRDECAAAAIDPASLAIVPVPTSFWRRLSRGLDHTLTLARSVAEHLDARVAPSLARTHRPSQVSVAAGDRWTNVRGTMRAVRPPPANTTIVLLDDVMTTGATMTEACRALRDGVKRNGIDPTPRTWAAVLAVSQLSDATNSPADGR